MYVNKKKINQKKKVFLKYLRKKRESVKLFNTSKKKSKKKEKTQVLQKKNQYTC